MKIAVEGDKRCSVAKSCEILRQLKNGVVETKTFDIYLHVFCEWSLPTHERRVPYMGRLGIWEGVRIDGDVTKQLTL